MHKHQSTLSRCCMWSTTSGNGPGGTSWHHLCGCHGHRYRPFENFCFYGNFFRKIDSAWLYSTSSQIQTDWISKTAETRLLGKVPSNQHSTISFRMKLKLFYHFKIRSNELFRLFQWNELALVFEQYYIFVQHQIALNIFI